MKRLSKILVFILFIRFLKFLEILKFSNKFKLQSAFWPPRREYYFFKPPPDDVIIEVNDEAEAILMQNRKKKLKKLKKAKKCVIGEYYQFGLSHPCADDVKYVRGFVLKTKNKNVSGGGGVQWSID